jgi:hypothetical protein
MQSDPMFSFMLAVHTAAGGDAYKTVLLLPPMLTAKTR